MSERAACGNCKHSTIEIEDDEIGPLLICRRYPPVMVDISGTVHGLEEAGHDVGVAWPPVSSDDWCGEWGERDVGNG